MIPLLLAKVAHAAANTANTATNLGPMGHFPAQSEVLNWCRDMGIGTAILLTLMGLVYLLYGWHWFKALIIINAGIVGGYAGALAGDRVGGYLLVGGIIGAGAAVAVGWPLMKWTVVWISAGLDPNFAWAGAMTGLVFFGMLSFILFRGSIIMYTSLQGAMMLVIGLLGLAYKHGSLAPTISSNILRQPLLLPVAVLVPAVLGLIYQQTHSPGGGGGGGAAPAPKK